MHDTPLSERLRAHLGRTGLLAGPGTAVLAVSGGPDSLAMLDLLAGLAGELRLELLVAHADHGILPESAAVAERVRQVARERYGLEAVVGRLELGAGAGETRARAGRYAFLRRVQEERGARYLVTAHHADDQAETVLLRILRGTAPAGLAVIAPRGPHGLVRPLLPFRRAELAAHAQAAGLPVFHDPSNLDPRHRRAWVRGTLMPVLDARLGAEAVEALLEVARHARAEVVAWDRLLDVLPELAVQAAPGRFEVARAALRGYHNVLAGRILRAAARRAGMRIGPGAAARLASFAVVAASGRRLDVGGGVIAEVAFDRLVLAQSSGTGPESFAIAGATGERTFGGYQLTWRAEPAPAALPREGWTTWLASDALAVRGIRPGDRLRPLGGVGHRPVRRLLMEAKVPRGDRGRYPLVATGDEVVWVPGVCRGDAAVPEPGTPAVRMDARAR